MKGSTKFWLGAGSALGVAWAWMRYGGSATLAASRMAPPGYIQQRYLVDATGKQWAVQFIYGLNANGKTVVYVVPIDPTKRGYPSVADPRADNFQPVTRVPL